MADRQVTKTRKGYDGDILTLCNPEESWSPRYKNDAIRDIEKATHNYFVAVNGKKIKIVVSLKRGCKVLKSEPVKSKKNILDELSNC